MQQDQLKGIILTASASLWWGILGVLYFKFINFANPIEITIHRTIWTAFLLIFVVIYQKKIKILLNIFKQLKLVLLFSITGLLIMVNWLTWIYSVSVNKLLDASLGYYIYPIFSVFLGILFLNEKTNTRKLISICLVFLSLGWLLFKFGKIPWIGLTVAISWSLYGLIRKKINIPSDLGLLCETIILTPIALLAFFYLYKNNLNIFSFNQPVYSFYLFWAGFMTLVPLYLFIRGFEIVGIGSASMIFFLTPTSQFFMSIFIYGEPIDLNKLIAFIGIWISVIIYLNEVRKE